MYLEKLFEQRPNVLETWTPTFEEPLPRLKCGIITPRGVPCPRWAIPGGIKCMKHGRTQQELQTAEDRLESARQELANLVDPAIKVLKDMVEDDNVPDAIRLKVATEILDRTGLKTADRLDVSVQKEEIHWNVILAKLEGNKKTEEIEGKFEEV